MLTGQEGKVLWWASPDDWSAVRDEKGETDQPIRFQGQQLDEESGLHYNFNRYYDPSIGRYVTQDPIGLAGGINVYSYVAAHPLDGADPLGLVEGWNLHSPVYDYNMWQYQRNNPQVQAAIDDPNVYPVTAHGDTDRMWGGYVFTDDVSVEEAARHILNDTKYKKGMTIILFSCNTGAGFMSFADKLARRLKALVIAPNAPWRPGINSVSSDWKNPKPHEGFLPFDHRE